jgi:hypothetical protein
MLTIVTTWLVDYGLMTAGGTIGVLIVGWILHRIPTDEWAVKWGNIGLAQGKAVTKFFNSKFPKLWNNLIEPIFIDFVHAFFIAWVSKFIEGLKSDN